ncbi:Glyoxalase-like domain-containing protein [Thermomonospora echinospora]|uniref:Glyoxalase-like domain-containing protein n=1 Tax=Thermomonospora echinospora TaxID=1992 RepID=A0A1H6DEC9_9ACTN|nr:VOC family protein [Thermomonospora echinospora]SEG83584.1 Glyoxalase-like domain-containing protein [Thermomonospora echinospora]
MHATPRVGNLAIDCADLGAMATFWGGLLGMKVTYRKDTWLDLEPLGAEGPVLSFQKVPEAKSGKNRLHLDLYVPDVDAAGARARELGGSPAGGRQDRPDMSFQIWRDPEGNEFCLVTRK